MFINDEKINNSIESQYKEPTRVLRNKIREIILKKGELNKDQLLEEIWSYYTKKFKIKL